jgi:membrane-associated phospholipid phosphatase
MNPLKTTLAVSVVLLAASTASADSVNTTQLTISDVLQYLPAAGAAAYTAYRHDTPGLWQLGEDVVANELATEALKLAFNETSLGRRPDGGNHSFPSGHTSLACSGASYAGERYGWEYSLPGFAVASYVGFIRVNERKHYIRDVVAGCALATGLSWLIVKPLAGHDVSIDPVVGGNVIGVNLHASW